MPKKKWQIINNSTRPGFDGLEIDGKKMKFRKQGNRFVIDSPVLARDIDKTYGRNGNQSVAVVPYNDSQTREIGHTYSFGSSPTFAKAWDAFERRKKRKVKNATRKTA